MNAILPVNYPPTKRYPVLYLLHGFSGNHTDWSQRTKLVHYLRGVPLIVVMPDGENSWYANTAPGYRFEDYIVFDLPRFVSKKYNADTSQQAIAGLSMCGYGAVCLGMKHPGRYKFVGSLSGALVIPRLIPDTLGQPRSRTMHENLVSTFGISQSATRDSNDAFLLFRSVVATSSPYFYFVACVQDEFIKILPTHRMVVDSLSATEILYEYHELPGRHNWQFWDREIQPLLKRMREVMKF